MRWMVSLLVVFGGSSLFAACLGDDPDSVSVPPEDASVADSAVDVRETPPIEPPPTDAASDAPAEDAAPTCKPFSDACRDTFVAKVKANCNPALETCYAKPECNGASSGPCKAACKGAFLDCQTTYENECVQCGKNAGVCDPSEDCHKSAINP